MTYAEDLTQGCVYIFELLPQTDIKMLEKLSDARFLLKSIDDMAVLDKILFFNVPYIFTAIELEKSDIKTPFLHLVTLGGKLKKEWDKELLNELTPYSIIYNRQCRIPHLGTLLFNGLFETKQRHYKTFDSDTILKLAAATNDIFIIYGQPSTGKTTLMKKMIKYFADGCDVSVGRQEGFSIHNYQKRLRLKNQPNYDLAHKVNHLKVNFQHFLFTKQSAVKALEALLETVAGNISAELSQSIMELMAKLEAYTANASNDANRLLKNIYSLPYNKIIYDDNGEYVLKEAIIRLKRIFSPDAEVLEKLAEAYDGTKEWFLQVSTVRKRLLVELYSQAEIYITSDQKDSIVHLFEAAAQELTHQADEAFNRQEATIINYIDSLPDYAEKINEYVSTGFNSPVMCGGILLADMDVCLSEQDIINKLPRAKKIVLFGCHQKGLFKIFSDAALCQERKDGISRIVMTDTNYRQHPQMAEFISRNFYEAHGVTKIKTVAPPDTSTPPFIWFDNSHMKSIVPHMLNMHSKGYTIAVITLNGDAVTGLKKQIDEYELYSEVSGLQVGVESDFRGKEFDIVYILDADSISATHGLCRAMSRAKKAAAIAGSGKHPEGNGILEAFYHICAGDSRYGIVYH